jgi:CheY-like chemotaxis protein
MGESLPARDAEPGRVDMSVLSERLSEGSLPGPAPHGAHSGPVPAVLWGQNVDTRLLLRGLLRLHRHPVVYEAATLEELNRLPASPEPSLLVLAVESEDGNWERDLSTALRRHPELRPVVILPRENAALEPRAIAAGARAVVIRPFAIRDLVRALTSATDGATTKGVSPRAESSGSPR